jgi:hypothetical protein
MMQEILSKRQIVYHIYNVTHQKTRTFNTKYFILKLVSFCSASDRHIVDIRVITTMADGHRDRGGVWGGGKSEHIVLSTSLAHITYGKNTRDRWLSL